MISFSRLGRLGRLGNQMFQYACAYSVAKRNCTQLSISTFNSYTDHQVNQLVETFNLSSSIYDTYSSITKQFQESDFSYDPRIENVLNETDLSGYFQSEKYFKSFRDDLLDKEFVFKSSILNRAINHKNILKADGSLCSIHVRMGDYKNLCDTHINLGSEYYSEALSLIPNCDSYLVFSDEQNEAKRMMEKLSFNRNFIYFDLDYSTSMCMMSMCDYHIIANSSFSWWGAWLSRDTKIVVAPSKWFGPKGPKNWNDIYCDGWKIV